MYPPYELHEATIALLGELAGVADEFHLMMADAVVRWILDGYNPIFRGPDNGVIRFRIESKPGEKLFDPILVREIHQFRPFENRKLWNRYGVFGHPAKALTTAITALEELAAENAAEKSAADAEFGVEG